MAGRLTKILLMVWVIFTACFLFVWHRHNQQRIVQFNTEYSTRLAIAAKIVGDDFQETMGDLLLLANSPAFHSYLQTGDQQQIAELNKSLLRHKRRYAQIHYVDRQGKELMRIDYIKNQPKVISSSRMLERDHPYRRSLQLAPQQIALSSMQLSLDQDGDNRSVPVLHFATPIRNSQQQVVGVLAINLISSHVLQHFHQILSHCRDCYLVNPNGQAIVQRPRLRMMDFSQRYPDAWLAMSYQAKGHLSTAHGEFVYTSIALGENPSWKLVALMPSSVYPALSPWLPSRWWLYYGLGLIIVLAAAGFGWRMFEKRWQMQRALRRSELEINELYHNAPCGYHSLDEQGIIIRMNSTELDWLGYEEQELVGKMAFSALLEPSSRVFFKHAFSNLKSQGEMRDVEYTMVRKDGSTFTVLLNAVAVFDRNKRFLMSRATVFDITQRKKVETALAQSEQILRNAFEYAPIGIMMTSLQGQFQRVNDSFLTLTQYTLAEIQQKTFLEITYSEDLARELPRIKDLLEGKINSYQIDKRIVTKTGDTVWINQNVSILHDITSHNAINLIVQVQEIMDRKEAEQELLNKAYYDSLTNLANRRLLLEHLELLKSQADRYNRSFAVLFMDLDKFKDVNDHYGHDVGDALLKAVGSRVQSLLRSSDLVARIAGDEFVVVLSETPSPQPVITVIEKLTDKLAQIHSVCGHEIKVTISVGVAFYPYDAESIDDLIKQADNAMYQAKSDSTVNYYFCQSNPERSQDD